MDDLKIYNGDKKPNIKIILVMGMAPPGGGGGVHGSGRGGRRQSAEAPAEMSQDRFI